MMIWYDQVDLWNIGAGAPYGNHRQFFDLA